MLVNASPRSLLSGAEVDVDRVLQKYNRGEFHHLFPKAFLKDRGVQEDSINCLANFAVISGVDNRRISKKPPSQYRNLCVSDELKLCSIMQTALCPLSLFDDDYDAFVRERSNILLAQANRHMDEG